MPETREVEVVRIGAQGHGVADGPDGPVYVRLGLPGERWRLGRAGAEPIAAGGERRPAPCRHFGVCGGCVAQHMAPALYTAWKQDLVARAFAHRGIAAPVAPMIVVSAHSRRRAVFGVTRKGGRVVLGFREEGRHTLVDLGECPVLHADIVAALGGLREIAGSVLEEGEGARLLVTRADNGLDVALEGARGRPGPDRLGRLAETARRLRLCRLVVGGAPVYIETRPTVMLGGVAVEVVPGAFLQAVAEAEARMVDLALGGLAAARRVGDLFCGLGTFTFPIARRARVSAVDSDRRSLAALAAAARTAAGLAPVEAKVRDLFREPLSRKELEAFDGIVLDPPRAGAKGQAEALARSAVPRIVYVSCNPATLARDARTLLDGGYRLEQVTPIDQFLYSPHVEVVAAFARS